MIIRLNDLVAVRAKHQAQKLVLTSGTYDLLHVGHVAYLEQAKRRGDVLVVLLSGDDRVKARKGDNRPVIKEADRARLLNALKVVDYVMIDPSLLIPDETDPVHAEIIKLLQPDFYVTDGPDPRFINLLDSTKFIIEERLQPEPSTTSIIHRIRQL